MLPGLLRPSLSPLQPHSQPRAPPATSAPRIPPAHPRFCLPPVPQALTSLAVMKKFHGSSVPSPRMKKISQTALYLRRGQRGVEKPVFCGKTDGASQGAVSTGREGSCCSQPLPQPLLASSDAALPRSSAYTDPLASYSSVTH